jgi:hypothetical protein
LAAYPAETIEKIVIQPFTKQCNSHPSKCMDEETFQRKGYT